MTLDMMKLGETTDKDVDVKGRKVLMR